MLLSQDFKDFAAFVCPVITMIGVIVTLIVTIQINKEILIGVNEMNQRGSSKEVPMLK